MKKNVVTKNVPSDIQKEDYNLNLLETNVNFDENFYFNHYLSAFNKLEFNSPINNATIPYMMSQEFSYSYFEVFKNIKPAIKETIPQILGRIKQFSNSNDDKFNMAFLDNIQAYSEILGMKQTQDILIPVLARVVDEKIEVKIHFLKVLYQNFVDYLCSIGDEGIYLLREKIIQIVQDLYREKNNTNSVMKGLLFKVFIKIAKSIIPREKDKKDNYIIDLVMSFGYESNVSKEFYLEHKKLCIKFIARLAEDFGQDWCENYLLPQLWFFVNEEEEDIKKQVLIALPFVCAEIRYEMIGTKIYKNINEIKIDPGSVKNFIELIEKLILDKQKSVREKIIECIGELISPLDKEELSQKIFNFYTNTIGEFYFNKEIVPIKKQKKNIKKKEEKAEDEEKTENVYYYFAFNFPAVLFCYGKEVWPKLGPIFKNLCKEKDMKVRRSIISSFHEISKIVGEQITESELLPLYDNFLNTKIASEKKFAIKNLPKILSNVSKEIKEKYFKYFDAVSIFRKSIGSKSGNLFFTNWRNKADVIEGILYYYHLYDKEIIYNSILPQCVNFCFDDVYKVRSISCKILANLILHLYNENYNKKELFELLELFSFHKKYYQRICFAKMCKVLLENNNLYNEKLKYLLYILVNNERSKGVNVALGKALSKVFKIKKYNCIKELSFHKICLILFKNESVSIKNMFKEIKIECDVKDEDIFDFKEINKLTENKVKIFDKDNSFIKKEFNFEISECHHKYPSREILIKNKNAIEINNNKDFQINENIINTDSNINKDIEDIKIQNIEIEKNVEENIINEELKIKDEENNKVKDKAEIINENDKINND